MSSHSLGEAEKWSFVRIFEKVGIQYLLLARNYLRALFPILKLLAVCYQKLNDVPRFSRYPMVSVPRSGFGYRKRKEKTQYRGNRRAFVHGRSLSYPSGSKEPLQEAYVEKMEKK
jgi:hypothetical protein